MSRCWRWMAISRRHRTRRRVRPVLRWIGMSLWGRATCGRKSLWGFLLAAHVAGCIQLETRIVLQDDGSATITERLRFSQRLLDLERTSGEAALERLLAREGALERMKRMGDGVTLVRHEVRDSEGGSRESVAVFRVADLNGFRYLSPWPAHPDFAENNVVECRLVPTYKSRPYASPKAGEMAVSFQYLKPPRREARLPEGAPPPRGPAPLDLQVHRELRPVLRDLLRGYHLRLAFEAYCPIERCGLGFRGRRVRANSIDLINVTDSDLDKYGNLFLENEELMLDLARWELGSEDIVSHVRDFVNNQTLPVFVPAGSRHMWWTGGSAICFKPSRALFDRHFEGRKLDPSAWAASPPEKHVPAVFESIGWTGKGAMERERRGAEGRRRS